MQACRRGPCAVGLLAQDFVVGMIGYAMEDMLLDSWSMGEHSEDAGLGDSLASLRGSPHFLIPWEAKVAVPVKE